jgi:CubicO group peptidase (beta-lactamase class C family)
MLAAVPLAHGRVSIAPDMRTRIPLAASFLLWLPLALAPAQTSQPGALAQARTSQPTALTAEQVQALAQRAFEGFRPPGLALIVVQDGAVLTEVALGERETGKPVTAATAFNIASCSKAFTAALIAQLVSEDRLGWDDRVIDHLPEFRMADPWITAHMTIRDLLSHRCGLVTFAGDLLWYGTDYDDAEVLRRLERLPIEQRFREQFGYQNLMYMVAGLVLQRVTGKSWEDLIEERLLRPLGMTGSFPALQRVPHDADRARPHIGGEQVADFEFFACKPAGAMWSSVHDLGRWLAMLLAGGRHEDREVLGAAAFREMWRPHVGIGAGAGPGIGDLSGYGLGWFLYPQDGEKLVEHDGGMPGFLSKVSLLPAAKFGFAVLNNGDQGIVNEAIKRALLAAHGGEDGMAVLERMIEVGKRIKSADAAAVRKREAARVPDTQPSLPLAAYAGRYEDAIYGPAEVRLEDERLHLTLLPARTVLFGAMAHWHHDVFRVDFPDRFLPFALVSFELDSTGRAERFRIDCPIPDFDFAQLDFRRRDGHGQ